MVKSNSGIKQSNNNGKGRKKGTSCNKNEKQHHPYQTSSSSGGSGFSICHILVGLLSLGIGIIAPHLWITFINRGSIFAAGEGRNLSSTTKTTTTSIFGTSTMSSTATSWNCNEETLSQYLHDIPIPGLHVVCVVNNNNNDEENSLVFFKESQVGQFHKLPMNVGATIQDWATLKQILVANLDLRAEDQLHQPWATFTPDGYKVLTETDPGNIRLADTNFASLRMFIVIQGGQWIWPGVRKGFRRTIRLDSLRGGKSSASQTPNLNHQSATATLETLSLFPLVVSVKGFLSESECDYIQDTALPSMKYSEVTLMDHDKGRPASDFRTSQTTFLKTAADKPILQEIDSRTASLVRIPRTHQESVQVLRYGNREKYDTHHDYFDPRLYQQDQRTLQLIQYGKRNRMATVFWYLTDVAEGGETVFPRVDKGPAPPNGQTFHHGLKVKPERGKVIIFYSMTFDGELDPYSLHGAAPVKEGIKWAANKWIWNMPTYF